jgi:hypothetical protein
MAGVPEGTAAHPARGSVGLTRAAFLFFLASLGLGVGVLLWASGGSYGAWPSHSDDMFYYLTLVRQSVQHGVVSSDGLRPTNGFHPLYFLLLRGMYARIPEVALPGAALGFLAVFHGAACVVLWATLRRLAGRGLAGLLAGLYAANPFVIGVVFAGVETALMVLCASVCLWAHTRWLECRGRGDRVLALAALSLTVAARTDMVMLAAALAIGPALRAWAASRPRRAVVALRAMDPVPLIVAAVPVMAFGVWSLRTSGEFLQTSGRALSFWQSVGDWRLIHATLSSLGALATPLAAIGYALYVAVQFIAWLVKAPLMLLGSHPLGMVLIGAGLAARLAGAREVEAAAEGRASRSRLTAELIAFLVLLWAFYALLFRHAQNWYWHGSVYVATLLVALWLAPLRSLVRGPAAARAWSTLPRGATAVLLIVAVGLAAVALDGQKPRRRAPSTSAADPAGPLEAVPDGATLGAFDTGQLAWEHPRLRVVNLDGLVNNAAYRALRARRIGRYMLEQRVEWLFVNGKVVDRFTPFGLGEWLSRAEEVSRNQGGVILFRLRPPTAAP